VVREERVYDQSSSVSNATPDVLVTMTQGRPLSAAGRAQVDRIIAKKREIAANQAQVQTVKTALENLTNDQKRFRDNIGSLRNVAGQEQLVQQYAKQLSDSEARFASTRDQQVQLERSAQTLQAELNTLIENTDF
jgi:chaperonin cofactor prefoldin